MRRRGVTLVELLITITVVGLIGTAMVRMLAMNSRATAREDAARDARRVARSALNLLESELRPVEPAGVISPTDNTTLTLREPYAIGLVCSISGGTTIALLPSGELPSTLTVDGRAGWAWRNGAGVYQYEATTTLGSGSASTCTSANIIPMNAYGGRIITTSAPSGTPTLGAIAFLFRQVTYSLRSSTSAPGKIGLFRTVASGNPEEIAAPFGATARFRWYMLANPLPQDTLPTVLADLRGVQFVLPGESRRVVQLTGQVATAPFTTSIFFQNRPN
ncbi:MAG: prepilin-type N-terminal cleavage/methylation domain-containing protein [Gemmatimonadales bacterium]